MSDDTHDPFEGVDVWRIAHPAATDTIEPDTEPDDAWWYELYGDDTSDQIATPYIPPQTAPPDAPPQPKDESGHQEPRDHIEPDQIDAPAWATRIWNTAQHCYALHLGDDSGWNLPRLRWAWRWTAPAVVGWGLSLLDGTTRLLEWFRDPAGSFWVGAVLIGAGGWIVIKTRRYRPVIAWLTRIPLATCVTAWLSLPITKPALAELTTTSVHTAINIINTLSSR